MMVGPYDLFGSRLTFVLYILCIDGLFLGVSS